MRLLVLLAALLLFVLVLPTAGRAIGASDPEVVDLRRRAGAVSDLSWVVESRGGHGFPDRLSMRRVSLLEEKQRRLRAGDADGVARINAVLAGEAFSRASIVLERWIPRIDGETGLLPTSTEPDGQVWSYGDTGSDLFPHLAIAARFLAPSDLPRFVGVLDAERRLSRGLPDDVALPNGARVGLDHADRVFGVAEYAKDGLLPLFERLGPEPWLGRLVEVADTILAESRIPTRHYGMLPADSTEVNGDMLQVLSRLFWATGDGRYLNAATAIAATYLEDVLPTTGYLPPNRWDFDDNEPIDRRRFRLSDHGNEVLLGIIEWHLADSMNGSPSATTHRRTIRRMLDRLLEKGRNPDGLWLRVIELPSGRVEQEGVTDSWGYVFQSFLTQALIEEAAPGGEPERAAVYRQAARAALRALPRYRFYEWETGKMDGYADSIEGAIYLLNHLSEPDAAWWVDDQIAVLYGFQEPDGRVLERDLDGNFIRTALLYGFSLTQGVYAEPWMPGLLFGSAADNSCLSISVYSAADWDGRLTFDTPRHREYLRLPADYSRLNQWPEWFIVQPDGRYTVADSSSASTIELTGDQMATGLPLQLKAGAERALRVCRAS